MSGPWIVRRPEPADEVRALGLALAAGATVGGIVYYAARRLLARERVRSGRDRGAAASEEGA